MSRIYGVALLSLCFFIGKVIGIWTGSIFGFNRDIGGVGFGIFLLIFLKTFLERRNLLEQEVSGGVNFWGSMYVPVIWCMVATLNVSDAFSQGFVAILSGVFATAIAFSLIPLILKFNTSKKK